MKDAVTRLGALQPARWGAIVWAGPGYGTHLDHVVRLGSQRLLLLEPHPALRERLARRVRGTPVLVEPQALAEEPGRRDFHLMNDPVRSSLLEVEAVLRTRPNLRCVESIQVEALALADVVAEHLPDGNEPNLLILDDTGMEAALLVSAEPGVLQAFSHILVGSSAGAAGAPTLDGFAAPQSFPSQAGHAWQLHVRRRASTRVDHDAVVRQQVEDLEEQVDSLSAERDQLVRDHRALEEALAEQGRALEEATQERAATAAEELDRLQATVAERDRALAEAKQASEATAAAQAAENAKVREANGQLRNRIAELEAAVARQQERLGEMDHRVKETVAERDRALAEAKQASEATAAAQAAENAKVREANGQLRNRIAELETAAAAQAAENAQLEEANGQLRNRTVALEATSSRQQERLGELDNRLKEAAQTARLATRMQAVSEQDLKDLQERYEESRRVQDHQHALLVQVSDRLGAAASHFHRLASDGNPVPPADDVVVFEQVRPAGKRGKRKPGRS